MSAGPRPRLEGPQPSSRSSRAARGGISSVLLRVLPQRSPLHELWAGTKLLCLLVVSAATMYLASWPAIIAAALVLLLGVRAGRVPRTAWPQLPVWFWTMTIGGAVGSAIGGGLDYYLRAVALALVVVGASLVVSWTTPMGQIAPAVAALLKPLRVLRVPVDEWAVAIGLVVRSLPPLLDEISVVIDAYRLRPRPWTQRGLVSIVRQGLRDLGDLSVAVLATCARRGAETGTAMVARGGAAPLRREKVRLGAGDLLALLVVVLAVTGAALADRWWSWGSWSDWLRVPS